MGRLFAPGVAPERERQDAWMSTYATSVDTASPLSHMTGNHEEFNEGILASEDPGHLVPTGSDKAPWSQTTLWLGDVALQLMQEGGPNFYQAGAPAEHVTFALSLPAPTSIWFNGAQINDGMAMIRRNAEIASRTTDVCRYCLLVVPFDTWIDAVRRFDPTQVDRLAAGTDHLAVQPSSRKKAVELVQRTLNAAGIDPPLAGSAAQEGVRQELISAFVSCAAMSPHAPTTHGRPRESRQQITARVREALNSKEARSYSVPELARHARVSERTLRSVVRERYGVSPKRLVILRQLADIRTALQLASPEDSIAVIARRHGVWDLGRFAQRYRAAYGENPSDTRRRG